MMIDMDDIMIGLVDNLRKDMQEQIDALNERVSNLEEENENLRFELDDVDNRTSGFAKIGRL